MNEVEIKSGILDTIWSNDGWVLGPFKFKHSFLYSEDVYMRWCKWNANEIRNRTTLGRDKNWCESIFLVKGEIEFKYAGKSYLLNSEGDYAVYNSLLHPKLNVSKDSTAIILRWRSKFDGFVCDNIQQNLELNRQWIIGSFLNKDSCFYSDEFEMKWGLKNDYPYLNPAKSISSISNFNWKSMGILCRGNMIYEYPNDKSYLGACGHYTYWSPNIPHSNSTDRPSLCLTLRWQN